MQRCAMHLTSSSFLYEACFVPDVPDLNLIRYGVLAYVYDDDSQKVVPTPEFSRRLSADGLEQAQLCTIHLNKDGRTLRQ